MNTVTLVVPTCPVCQKPVEAIEQWRDECRMRTYFRVRCHGEEDLGWLEDSDRHRDDPITPVPFSGTRLPNYE